jgi:hypothetical protein
MGDYCFTKTFWNSLNNMSLDQILSNLNLDPEIENKYRKWIKDWRARENRIDALIGFIVVMLVVMVISKLWHK